LIDTDVVIDCLRGYKEATRFVESNMHRSHISVNTVSEVRAGVRTEAEMTYVESLLSLFPILQITEDIAKAGGDLMRRYGRSHSLEIPDALIASTAYQHDLELKTLNVKHYPMFEGLKPAYRKTPCAP
jgi:predicted nucleic acid-binding protein